jgi:hypothetical protein
MSLILPKKESSYSRWYKGNKGSLSQKRKRRYADDAEYRERRLEASRRRRRGERSLRTPPDHAPISFVQAAERIGVSVSSLHSWRRQKLFPEPKHHNGRLWFDEKQVLLLKDLKDKVCGKRRWYMKTDRFKEVIAYVHDNWD